MVVLRIEHKVPGYDGWKKAFDDDPIDRKKSGVKIYRIFRPADDPNYIIIDLCFDEMEMAEKALEALKIIWGQVEGTVMTGPKTRMLNVMEEKEV